MRIRFGQNNYGKSRVRMLRLSRQENHHEIKELTLEILFEGEFDEAHTAGDNRKILPTDTIKNTVYVLAKQYPPEPIEEFADHLIEHFLTYNPQVSRVKDRRHSNIPGTASQSAANPIPHRSFATGTKDEPPWSAERAKRPIHGGH